MRTDSNIRFQTRLGKGAHLDFPGAYVCGSINTLPIYLAAYLLFDLGVFCIRDIPLE